MENYYRMSYLDAAAVRRYWGGFFLWGLLLLILGIVAVSATVFTTMVTMVFLGVLILLGGVVIIVDAFSFWWGKWSGFFLHLIMGVLYVIFGFMLIENPILGSISITLLLGVFYLMLGIFRIIDSLSLKVLQWGWSFFSGLIALLLGILILANWPSSSLYIIGLFVGIDLIFIGWAYMMTALYARSLK